jgi:hypothetical protein
MTHRNPVARISRPASRSAALGLVFAMLAACAPDAVQNYDATGFNGGPDDGPRCAPRA